MKMKMKRLLGILLCLAMVLGMMPGMAIEVKAETPDEYVDVSTYDQLSMAITNGKNIRLTADITVTSALSISSNRKIIIDGNGKKLTGNGSTRAFNVNGTLTLKDITLSGFKPSAGGGGAISNSGILTAINAVFSGNAASNSGAIYNSGTLVLDRCTFLGNSTTANQGGGAIENGGKLYASGTMFSGNMSKEIGGAINNYQGYLYLTGCNFENNYTTKTSGEYGGAIGNNSSNKVRIINCNFSGNYYGNNSSNRSDFGVYSTTDEYTIAGCDSMIITPSGSGMSKTKYGAGVLDYTDLNDIKFVYAADNTSVLYSLVVDGAANTKFTGAIQVKKQGVAIDTITFTANPYCYFDDFGKYTKNGITVEKTSKTNVTVSGALTGDTRITIPDAVDNSGKYTILTELYTALENEVWTGYGVATGVISYSRGDDENEFRASFMGGKYTFDVSFDDVTSAEKTQNTDDLYTYKLVVPLPAYTGLTEETLNVTVKEGHITELESEKAGLEMHPPVGNISSWSALNGAMNNGGIFTLSGDLTAEESDSALTVPEGKTVVIDLSGHTIDRKLGSAVANGNVIINNGTLAIMDSSADDSNSAGTGKITGGNTTRNGGGILNNGTLTLYGGEITGNNADENGGGVYNSKTNTETTGFWMTGGLIDGNTASFYPAIGGDVTFNTMSVVQVNESGKKVSVATATAGMSSYSYVKPVMPDNEMLAILSELYIALGNDIWTGYGVNTGVISYSRGDDPNEFRASFMGGTYTFDVPFGDVSSAKKDLKEDDSATYTLVVPLPAYTGMEEETLTVTVKDGEITGLRSEKAGLDMSQAAGEIAGWEALNNAMANGGVFALSKDLTAGNADSALTVPVSKTVVIDLNGHTINRALGNAADGGSVIINNGTLAIMDSSADESNPAGTGKITGGNTTGNGGGIVNNGVFTLYGGKITGNIATENGGGVYNSMEGPTMGGFWMTGGVIAGNTAESYPAVYGDVIFNDMAVIQVDDGKRVSAAKAKANMDTYSYVEPVMPDTDMLEILTELYGALGDKVWTGYGEQTGVISYSRVEGKNEFRASFMGGNYTFDVPFGDIESASRKYNEDGSATYTLVVPLPVFAGIPSETLTVTIKDGEVTGLHSENVGLDMNPAVGEITGWADLNDNMAKGGVFELSQDLTSADGNTALIVPAGKTVVIDLNGHTINRALGNAADGGSVIINNGTLAVMDSSANESNPAGTGKITGGNTTGNGGGILNNGTFTLYGGEITGNKATGNGGGVYNDVTDPTRGGFWMTGGLIDENTAESYPAIGGDVIFNNQAKVQVDSNGTQVSVAEATANMGRYSYVKPVMPDIDEYEEQYDASAAAVVTEMITALPEPGNVDFSAMEAIEASRAAYDMLTEAQKALVENYDKLIACEEALTNRFAESINSIDKITEENKDSLNTLLNSYDELNESLRERVNAKIGRTGTKKLSDLEEALDVATRIYDLPGESDIKLENEKAVTLARTSYELLSDSQEAMISKEALDKLAGAEAKLVELKEQAALKATKASAIERLKDYAEAKALADATDKETSYYNGVISEENDKINVAANPDEVATALTNAKKAVDAALDKIKSDRAEAAAIAAARQALDDAQASVRPAQSAAEAAKKNSYISDTDKAAVYNAESTLNEAVTKAGKLPEGAKAEQINAVAKEIADAVKALNKAIETANDNSAIAKAAEEAEVAQLAAAKISAKERLEDYSEAKALADATTGEKEEYDKAVADGKDAIDNAENTADVATALTNAKKAVDKVLAEIEQARAEKAAAEAEMAEADQALNDAVESAKTAKAEAVKAKEDKYAPEEYKQAIDTANDLLDEALRAAAELPKTATAKDKRDKAAAINDAVNALGDKIDIANVNSAAAKAAEEAAETAAAQLASAKEAAIERLEDYSQAKTLADATSDEKEIYDKAVDDGKTAINAAPDKDKVAEALTAAKKAVDDALTQIRNARAAAEKAAEEMAEADKAIADAKLSAEAAKTAADQAIDDEYISEADENAVSTAKGTLEEKIREAEALAQDTPAEVKKAAAEAIMTAVENLKGATDTANLNSAATRKAAEEAATEAEQLKAAKNSAIERLSDYSEAKAITDATQEEKEAYDKAVTDGISIIDRVDNKDDVASALTSAKGLVNDALAKIEADRAEAAKAVAEMAAAVKALSDAKKSAEEAVSAADSAAADEYASADDKKAISDAKEALAKEVGDADKLPEDATAEQKNTVAQNIAAAVGKLNKVTDAANVNSAAARTKADEEATAAARLEAAKTSAKGRLDDYSGARALSDATPEEKEAYDKAVADGKKAIEEAADQDAVTAALNEAKTAVDKALAKIGADRAEAAKAAAEMAEADKALSDARAAAETAVSSADRAAADEYASADDKKAIGDAKEALAKAVGEADKLPKEATAEQKNTAALNIAAAVEELNKVTDAANVNTAAARAAADEEATAAAQLEAAKTSAAGRLDDYSEAKALSDATPEEKEAYDKAVADGKKAISEAVDQEAVTQALKDAKAAVDAALAKIEADRAAAEEAAAEMAVADKAVSDAKASADTAVSSADRAAADEYASEDNKKAIGDAKEALAKAIEDADKLPEDATAEQKNAAAKAIEDAVKDLNTATDKANIDSAAARADAEEAATKAEKLAAAKAAAIGRLDDYSELKALEDATEDEKSYYDGVVAGEKGKINDATDQDAVTKALTAAKEAVNAAIEKIKKDRGDASSAEAVTAAINALPAKDKITEDDRAAIEAARAAYEALSADQKALVTADTLKKLKDAEDQLVILKAMSEVSAKTGSDVICTGEPLILVNGPSTVLPEGYTMQYALGTDAAAEPAAAAYSTSIPTGTEAGTYYVWYKVRGEGDRGDSKARVVSVSLIKDDSEVLEEDIPEGGIPEGIWIAGVKDLEYTGKALTQEFRLYDGKKRLIEKKDYTVSYKNNTKVYTVKDPEKMTAEDEKNAPSIIIRMKGNYGDVEPAYFNINAIDISTDGFSVSDISTAYNGLKQTPAPVLTWNGKKLKAGTDFTVKEYIEKKDDRNAFKGQADKTTVYDLTVIGIGNFTGGRSIKLTIAGKTEKSESKEVPVVLMKDVKTPSIPEQKYTGEEYTIDALKDRKGVKLAFTVLYKSKVLAEGKDYEAEFTDARDAGTATLILRGRCSTDSDTGFCFAGEKRITFKIAGLQVSKASVGGIAKSYAYTGNEITPAVTLTIDGKAVPAEDYSVAYEKNVNVGTATAVITGHNSCQGTKKVNFRINPYDMSTDRGAIVINDGEAIETEYVKGGAQPKISVTFNGNKLFEGSDYTVKFSNNNKAAGAKAVDAPAITITGKGSFKGSKGVNFTIRQREFTEGNGLTLLAPDVNEGSKIGSAKIKILDSNGKELKAGTDYEKDIKYFNAGTGAALDKNTKATAGMKIRAEVRGMDTYTSDILTGEIRVIDKTRNISKAKIKIAAQKYTGREVKITDKNQFTTATIKIDGQERNLILGEDFEIVEGSYINNMNKGTAKVTIHGLEGGRYGLGGYKTVTFKIGTRSISEWWKGIFAE